MQCLLDKIRYIIELGGVGTVRKAGIALEFDIYSEIPHRLCTIRREAGIYHVIRIATADQCAGTLDDRVDRLKAASHRNPSAHANNTGKLPL
jgi:hypothetical protein